jgi:hypothetical protein
MAPVFDLLNRNSGILHTRDSYGCISSTVWFKPCLWKLTRHKPEHRTLSYNSYERLFFGLVLR